jgi:uncharacterized protein YpmS
MGLSFWRDLAIFLLALLFIGLTIVLSIFLLALGNALRKAERELDLKLKQWNRTAQLVQGSTKRLAAPIARPFVTLIALKEGTMEFLRTFLKS